MFKFFRSKKSIPKEINTLGFEGLNPLLAKQLSELEFQIGQLAQAQYALSQEREKMRSEMNELKNSIRDSAPEMTELTPQENKEKNT